MNQNFPIPNSRTKIINISGIILLMSAVAIAMVVGQGSGKVPPIAYLMGACLTLSGLSLMTLRQTKFLDRSGKRVSEKISVFGLPIRRREETFELPAELEVRQEIIQGNKGHRRRVHRIYLISESGQLRLETYGRSSRAETMLGQLRNYLDENAAE